MILLYQVLVALEEYVELLLNPQCWNRYYELARC
jgi:hypothetical protein